MKRIVVFFAWQSDLPNKTNRSAISHALRVAANSIEEARAKDDVHIVIEEAVRNEPGSPNIPETIRTKIESSDIFLCDISIINSASNSPRKTPNPNVLFELGYAAAYLDWRRVVMLFNSAYGEISDLPFDIDRQRVSPYSFSEDAADTKSPRSQLSNLLTEALSCILEKEPPKAVESRLLNPEVERRRRDVEMLRQILAAIHWPTLDLTLQNAPKYIDAKVFYFWESFNGIIESSRFHLYDQEVISLIKNFHQAWQAILSHGDHYEPHGGTSYAFTSSVHSTSGKKAWSDIELQRDELVKAKSSFLDYIRANYLELHPDRLSEEAWTGLIKFRERLDKPMKK